MFAALFNVSFAARPANDSIVIQFADGVSDPERPAFVEELSDYTGVPLRYVQPKAKGKHEFRVARSVPKDKLTLALQRLASRDDVYRVEIPKRKTVPGKGGDAKF